MALTREEFHRVHRYPVMALRMFTSEFFNRAPRNSSQDLSGKRVNLLFWDSEARWDNTKSLAFRNLYVTVVTLVGCTQGFKVGCISSLVFYHCLSNSSIWVLIIETYVNKHAGIITLIIMLTNACSFSLYLEGIYQKGACSLIRSKVETCSNRAITLITTHPRSAVMKTVKMAARRVVTHYMAIKVKLRIPCAGRSSPEWRTIKRCMVKSGTQYGTNSFFSLLYKSASSLASLNVTYALTDIQILEETPTTFLSYVSLRFSENVPLREAYICHKLTYI